MEELIGGILYLLWFVLECVAEYAVWGSIIDRSGGHASTPKEDYSYASFKRFQERLDNEERYKN
jgi:hypothetical protein